MNSETGRKKFKSYIIYYWLFWVLLLLLFLARERIPFAFISSFLHGKASGGIFLFTGIVILIIEKKRISDFFGTDNRKKYKQRQSPFFIAQERDDFRFLRYLFSDQDETNPGSPIYQVKMNDKNLFWLLAAMLASAILAPSFFL